MSDILTATIAVAAFVLSLVTAYFQFRRVTNLRFAFLDLELLHVPEREDSIGLDFALINSGNRPATLRKLAALVPFADGNLGQRDWRDSLGEHSHRPVVVKPGESVVGCVRFPFSRRTIEKAAGTSELPQQIHIKIVAALIDPSGNMVERELLGFHLKIEGQQIHQLSSPPPHVVKLLPIRRREPNRNILVVP